MNDTEPTVTSVEKTPLYVDTKKMLATRHHRADRLAKADMLSTEEAAALVRTSRVTINSWIAKNRCMGLDQVVRGLRVPAWQFEPRMWDVILQLFILLNTRDSWVLLSWLETPQGALEGRTPRVAVEQGDEDKVLMLATHGE